MEKLQVKRYEKYKDSKIKWLGQIPASWEVRRNKNVFYEASQLSKDGSETLLTVSHITGVTPRSEKNVNMFMAETMQGYKVCKVGDLVINTMWAWMGALGTVRHHGICSPAYGVYRPIKGVPYSPRYFDYLFRTPNFVTEMTRSSKGIVSSRLRLYAKDFYQLQTVVPSFEEQEAIADYLDKRVLALDKTALLLEQKISKFLDLKKTLATETVCRGLDPTAPRKHSGVPWMGIIPAHWEVKRLKDVAKTIKGRTLEGKYEQEGSALPVLSLEYLRNEVGQDTIYCEPNASVTLASSDDYVIIWDGAGVGEMLKGKRGILSSTIAKLVFNRKVFYPHYFYYLRGPIEHIVKGIPAGMGIPHLNPIIFNNIPCPCPPMAEQVRIVAFLDQKTQKIDSIVTNLRTQIETIKELRKTLIDEVVTGKLKVIE